MAQPRVSIGLPVYNGENYLQHAIDSVLAQTMGDFELIISDNASTDRTQEICEANAAADPRIRYERQATNLGAAPNYNRTLELARAPYFKWLAHDDYVEPTFLEATLPVLEANPDAVVACTRVLDVNVETGVNSVIDHDVSPDAALPEVRFREFLDSPYCFQVFGLMRTEVLRQTEAIGSFSASDNFLMAVLGLYGRIIELPEPLIAMRHHLARSVSVYLKKQERSVWFDTSLPSVDVPTWRAIAYCIRGILRAPLTPAERVKTVVALVDWALRGRWRVLGGEMRQMMAFKLQQWKRRQQAPAKTPTT
jgi:glycosyltransferase involved in cell wall biosynthesis